MNPDNERNLGYDPEVALQTATPSTERGSRRWNIRRILAWGIAGAVVIPLGASMLTVLLGHDLTPSSEIEDIRLKFVLGWLAFCGGGLCSLWEISNQVKTTK